MAQSHNRLMTDTTHTDLSAFLAAPADGSADLDAPVSFAAQIHDRIEDRRLKTVSRFSRIGFVISTISLISYAVAAAFTGNGVLICSMILSSVTALASMAAYLLARRSYSISAGVALSGGVTIACIIATALCGFDSGFPISTTCAAIMVTIILGQRAILVALGVITASLVAIFLTQDVFSLWHAPFAVAENDARLWVNAIIIISAVVVDVILLYAFVRQLNQAFVEIATATAHAQAMNEQVLKSATVNQQVSAAVQNLSMELASATRQQLGGSTEQVAAVVQVTTSMEELTETARQIATNTTDVSTAATHALDSATHVQSATERAEHVGVSGRRAVDAAIFGIETVRDKIENLATKLLLLAERSQQISAIIGLITAIADETHLLSLNAAIESAGAGENGARFAVIANEVKGLADRSLEATRDVRSVIADVQAAIAAAVLAAEEGKKETVGAVELAYQAGEVIGDLGGVITTASDGAHTIVGAVATVVQLAEEIALATRQQQSASDQVVLTLRSIGQVAREVASGNSTITQAVGSLRDLSTQLILRDARE